MLKVNWPNLQTQIPQISKDLISKTPYCAGPLNAKIVFVGEAPGAEEERTGLPFVGASGKLLRRHVSTTAYYTNILKTRPPRNDFTEFLKNNPREVSDNVAFLAAELLHTNANVYVAVGEYALNVLCNRSGITKWNGSILEATMPTIKGKKVIPLIHPAAVLREWKGLYPLFQLALKRINTDQFFPELRIPERTYIIRPKFNDVVEFLSSFTQDKVVAFDIETKNMTVASVQLAQNNKEAICIPFMLVDGTSYWPTDQEVMIWRMLQKTLYSHRLIGQNVLRFDIPFLYTHGFSAQKLYEATEFDTLLGMRCYEPQLPAGLDFLTFAYTREPYYKDDIKEWKNENEETFWIYGCKDVLVLHEIYPQLRQDLIRDNKLDFYYEWYHKVAKHQMDMTLRGMRVDLKTRAELEKQFKKDILYNQSKLTVIVGENVNVQSSAQLKKLFYEKMKLQPITKQGKVSMDRDSLLKLSVRHKSDVFQCVLKIRELRKLYSTYIKTPLDSDGRFRASFGFTETGRFTSSSWVLNTGGNSQNVPESMRIMVVPDPGYVFLGCDGSQAEARVVAWYAQEQQLMQIFREGGDIHTKVASLLFDKRPEDITKTERYIAKRIVHGSNYAMGPARFAMAFNQDVARFNLDIPMIDTATAKTLQEKYYTEFSGIKNGYHKKIEEEVCKKKELSNPFGRRIRFHDRIGEELYKEAYAWVAQSTVADFTNEIMKRTVNHIVLVNQEHDGLLFMVKENEVDEAIEYIKERANITLFNDLVIPVEFKVGHNWGKLDAYSKR